MTLTITSFTYFIFLLLGAIVYYLAPKKIQWLVLLIFSLFFYVFAANPYTYILILMASFVAWISTNRVKKLKSAENKENKTKVQIWTIGSIVFIVILWFIFKGQNFYLPADSIVRISGINLGAVNIQLIAALGMGYYTLQVIGYIVDCYWDNIIPEANYLKLLLFTSFFPQLTTGPISKFNQLDSLFNGHKFSFANLTHGTQRIVWGLLKKLVVAERLALIINPVWEDLVTYKGIFTWVAFLIYPIQMYCDFSGCMDIVIGSAEIFDITLADNFRNPFFSKTSQEFWQRWHITLGNWARDYVLYPLMKSKWMVSLGKMNKNRFGKKRGKFITTSVGMLVLWLVMGIWHGDYKYIVGVSLWYWIILMLGDLTKPLFEKITYKLDFKTQSFGWKLFQCARTYLIYAVGAVFFRTPSVSMGFDYIKTMARTCLSGERNISGFALKISEMGFEIKDLVIIIISIVLLLVVAVLRERNDFARNWLDQQPVVFRYAVYLGILFMVITLGKYGPGYDSGAFIYGKF